jgi:hypothetical protein
MGYRYENEPITHYEIIRGKVIERCSIFPGFTDPFSCEIPSGREFKIVVVDAIGNQQLEVLTA